MAAVKHKRGTFSEEKMAEMKADYCLGAMTNKAIANKYDISIMTVHRWAEELEWTRGSLSHAAKAVVSKELRAALTPQDNAVIASYADLCVSVMQTHRDDICDARALSRNMFGQLTRLCSEPVSSNDELQEVEERDVLFNLATKARILRELATSLALLQKMERTAYGITEEVKPVEQEDLQSIREKLTSLVATESGGAWQVN